MLESCFLHIPGIGPAMSAKLKEAGIATWNDALHEVLPCGMAKRQAIREHLTESLRKLAEGDARWFGNALPAQEQWRLYPHFRHQAAYVDIETSGLYDSCFITTIALYDGCSVRTYVQGENLEAFADDILAYKLLVTWNGRSFDAPILRRSLGIPLDKGDMAHLDLLPVFRALGLRGGLKKVEKKLGLDREDLDGVDGWAAVRLWNVYERTGDRRMLETLLAYNVADVLSLKFLAEYACARFYEESGRAPVCSPEPVNYAHNPFSPDRNVLRNLLGLAF